MIFLKTFLISLVAFEHIYFLILEMFLWTKPKGIKTFGLKSKEFAEDTKILAANQGLYNGFLAAGLIYSIILKDNNASIFFLICVMSPEVIRMFFLFSDTINAPSSSILIAMPLIFPFSVLYSIF